MTPTLSDGTPITVRPIERGDLDRVVLRCWPERRVIERIFADQGTIGMAAWEGDKCVGQLHCYRVMLPDGINPNWPNSWWSGRKVWTEWEDWGPGMKGLCVAGPGWFHACCHVGRTLETVRRESRNLIRDLGPRKDWSPERIFKTLQSMGACHIDLDTIKSVIKEIRSSGGGEALSGDPDPRYFGRGIGTAMCEASIQWAREHGYAAVMAVGAPADLFEFAAWAGHLPWTTYARLGFRVVNGPNEGDGLPNWANGDSPPEVMAQVMEALASDRPPHELRERLMMIELKNLSE